jgi:hypothetical protein
MNPEERSQKNSLAFSETTATPAGFKMRPVGYKTLSWMRLLELTLGEGEAAMAALSQSQKMDQLHAFLFIQSAPIDMVHRAVRSYVKRRAGQPANAALSAIALEFFHPWLADLPPDALDLAGEQLGEMDEITAAVVDAKPPKDHKPERPDPN